ncbi:hypothetical protein [Endozoicomonas arenosclerae]|uniref:hypothetical protein n=1 Tax=Endozoicomonas arenosclerae TaxID=1633495 RepID=UPI0007827245|nr:hypothetical protein [Endozoicomonas arenosclerae]
MSGTYNQLLSMIETVARALGDDLLPDVAFVGGCTTGLLLTDDFTRESVRATDDVDLIVNVMGYGQWHQLKELLKEKGFSESMEDDVICRMRLGELQVDIMPDDASVLGFSNRWYAEALKTAQSVQVTDDLNIRLLTPPYFIATKLDAWLGRGKNDAFHRDLEDLLNLFDGRESLVEELSDAPGELQAFVAAEISKLLELDDFEYAVQSTARGDQQREEIIFERLETACQLKESGSS